MRASRFLGCFFSVIHSIHGTFFGFFRRVVLLTPFPDDIDDFLTTRKMKQKIMTIKDHDNNGMDHDNISMDHDKAAIANNPRNPSAFMQSSPRHLFYFAGTKGIAEIFGRNRHWRYTQVEDVMTNLDNIDCERAVADNDDDREAFLACMKKDAGCIMRLAA